MTALFVIATAIQSLAVVLFSACAALDRRRGWRWPLVWGLIAMAQFLVVFRRVISTVPDADILRPIETGFLCVISSLLAMAAGGALLEVRSGRKP